MAIATVYTLPRASAYTILSSGGKPMRFHTEGPYAKRFRNARATLSAITKADHECIILDRDEPVAIVVPIPKHSDYRPGEVWKARAEARKTFQHAIILAFRGSGHAH